MLLPNIPEYATNNAHMFYMVCRSMEEGDALISLLKENKIYPVFHYLSLHKSSYYGTKHDGRNLTNADRFSDCLVRLPFYYELSDDQQTEIIRIINIFYSDEAREVK